MLTCFVTSMVSIILSSYLNAKEVYVTDLELDYLTNPLNYEFVKSDADSQLPTNRAFRV